MVSIEIEMAPEKAFRILLVDDEPDLVDILSMQFSATGCKTQGAGNGREALNLLKMGLDKGECYDVVVSDLNMPEMNGMDLLKEMRNLKLPTPFVFFTGYGDKEKTIEAMRLGAFDFLDKPSNPSVLIDSVLRAAEFGRSFQNLDQVVKDICQQYHVPPERFDAFRIAEQQLIRSQIRGKKN